jgi:hypothetical protein
VYVEKRKHKMNLQMRRKDTKDLRIYSLN